MFDQITFRGIPRLNRTDSLQMALLACLLKLLYMFVCLFVRSFGRSSVCLIVCLFVCFFRFVSVCLFVCLFVSFRFVSFV